MNADLHMENDRTYTVAKDTQVLVVDENHAMHKHRMRLNRQYRGNTRLVLHNADEPAFTGVDSTQIWTLQELFGLKMVVFVTGHSRWPYIIIEKNHLLRH